MLTSTKAFSPRRYVCCTQGPCALLNCAVGLLRGGKALCNASTMPQTPEAWHRVLLACHPAGSEATMSAVLYDRYAIAGSSGANAAIAHRNEHHREGFMPGIM